jgi:hypothetical protein
MENLHFSVSVDDCKCDTPQGVSGKVEQAVADALKAAGLTFNYVRLTSFNGQIIVAPKP